MATNQVRREAAKRKLERQQERRAEQTKRRQRVATLTSVGVVVLVVVGVVLVTTLGSGPAPDPAAAPETSEPTAPDAATVPQSIPTEVAALPVRPAPLPDPTNCEYAPAGEPAKSAEAPLATDVSSVGTTAVTLQMNAGTVPLTLDQGLAPCTVNSFVSLARQGYFDTTPCHRLTTDPGLQVLQCGDPSGTGTGGPGYSVPDEVFPELTYGRGILAMANSGTPNSGGSQFFMVYGDGQLPPEYTVFGSISPAGLAVVDEIARRGHDNSLAGQAGGGSPVDAVTIQTMTAS